jgi:4-hydroxy-3-methylbut-2-enyl diphosphate reductase
VNDRLRAGGIRFLSDPEERGRALGPADVVILPAFGITVAEMVRFTELGCTLVDTTCGSVLNVWKNVVRYAQDGFTSVIHGKVRHEETRATASQALKYPNGRYLVVLDRDEAAVVCDYIRHGGDREAFLARFGQAVSPGFDPDVDLQRVGCANQTTMLMSESLEIGEMFGAAMRDRYGAEGLARHFRAFDTICSATQERQDAVEALLDSEHVDLMLVVGGYNSSNTCNLARICAARARTYHISDPSCLLAAERIRHRPVGAPSTAKASEVVSEGWLPESGPVVVGLTAGASTPNNIVGQVIETLERFTGIG